MVATDLMAAAADATFTTIQCNLDKAHTHMHVCFHMNISVPWCVYASTIV